jgi:tetratricopeptide (TPR) repeat protein
MLAARDLPPELPEWVETLEQENVRTLSVMLITDLLRLEEDPQRAADLMRDMVALVDDLFLAGDFENALLHYRALLQRNELNAQAHNNLGLLYRDKGLLDEAVREFQRALFIDSGYVTAHNNLGVALLGQGRLDEAAAEFRTVLEGEPKNVDATINLALVEKAEGRLERAKETLLRALGTDPRNAAAHYNLAAVYEQSGEAARAIEHYRAFLANAGSQHATRAADVRTRLKALERGT